MHMLGLFTPDYYIHRFNALRPQYLLEHGIKLLICDIDNTLVAHDEALPNEEVRMFLTSIAQAGIKIVFISNNVEERVNTFAKELGYPYYSFAMKPLPLTYWKMMKNYKIKKSQIAVLGDQLMTDVLGANVVGLHTILTAPVVTRDLACTKMNRKLEAIVFARLEKKQRLTKGVYDE